MTEETAIERLDYSKPPPGYVVEETPADERHEPHLVARAHCDVAYAERRTLQEALAAAWVHYRNRNDPPGMRVIGTGDGDQTFAGVRHFFLSHTGIDDNASARREARAAAWSWHDRRHAIAGRLTLQDAWPRCLRWTDAECDQVDRWIANGEETPECFWVQLKPASVSEALAGDWRQALEILEVSFAKRNGGQHG